MAIHIDVEKIEKQRNKKTRDIIKVNEEFERRIEAKKKYLRAEGPGFSTDSLNQEK